METPTLYQLVNVHKTARGSKDFNATRKRYHSFPR